MASIPVVRETRGSYIGMGLNGKLSGCAIGGALYIKTGIMTTPIDQSFTRLVLEEFKVPLDVIAEINLNHLFGKWDRKACADFARKKGF